MVEMVMSVMVLRASLMHNPSRSLDVCVYVNVMFEVVESVSVRDRAGDSIRSQV